MKYLLLLLVAVSTQSVDAPMEKDGARCTGVITRLTPQLLHLQWRPRIKSRLLG